MAKATSSNTSSTPAPKGETINQAAIGRADLLSALTGTTNLALVASLVQKPRKEILELLDLVGQIDDPEICELIGAATQMMIHRPRYPARTSVGTEKKRDTILKLMGLAYQGRPPGSAGEAVEV